MRGVNFLCDTAPSCPAKHMLSFSNLIYVKILTKLKALFGSYDLEINCMILLNPDTVQNRHSAGKCVSRGEISHFNNVKLSIFVTVSLPRIP